MKLCYKTMVLFTGKPVIQIHMIKYQRLNSKLNSAIIYTSKYLTKNPGKRIIADSSTETFGFYLDVEGENPGETFIRAQVVRKKKYNTLSNGEMKCLMWCTRNRSDLQ